MLLYSQPGMANDLRLIKEDGLFANDVRTTDVLLMERDFVPLVRSPRAIHGGRLPCATDASMADNSTTGGFGFIVGSRYAHGLWPQKLREAFAMGHSAISPLKYAVELFVHRLWAREHMAEEAKC